MTKQNDRPENASCAGCYGMTYIPELDRRFILCNNQRSDHYGHVLDALHCCEHFGQQTPEDQLWFNDNPEGVSDAGEIHRRLHDLNIPHDCRDYPALGEGEEYAEE